MARAHDERAVAQVIGDRHLSQRHGDQRAVAAVGCAPTRPLVGRRRVVPARREVAVRVAEHLVHDLLGCGRVLLFLLLRVRGFDRREPRHHPATRTAGEAADEVQHRDRAAGGLGDDEDAAREQAAGPLRRSRRRGALDQHGAVPGVDRRAERQQLAAAQSHEAVLARQLYEDLAFSGGRSDRRVQLRLQR